MPKKPVSKPISKWGLQIDKTLYEFVNNEVLKGLTIDADKFWQGFATALTELTPKNRALLKTRQLLQDKIDAWHKARRGETHDAEDYMQFLQDIGYIVPEGADFQITTQNLDAEIASVAAPQLVVPVLNARFALNAANARWGSLYNALYGTDAIPSQTPLVEPYDRAHGDKVVAAARAHLNTAAPLMNADHKDAVAYSIADAQLVVRLKDTTTARLAKPEQLQGWAGEASAPESILLKTHGLHIELIINHDGLMGATDPAGINDIMIEAALTTIIDFEDSIAAVDAEDKINAYRNWLGLTLGNAEARFSKNGKKITRKLAPDREFSGIDGTPLTLPGRALMLVRNVGHLMTTAAVLDAKGEQIFEGILDAFITCAIATHDLKKHGKYQNSRENSIYIVKPKMHGPDEVAFACEIFAHVETLLNLPENTIKIGIMDEERRTSANLKECIRAASARVFFINTGFLDRTGDEIHTSMEAGAMVNKTAMKSSKWIIAYEDWNVDVGLACGFSGKAQIGKGMWAMPDRMAAMMQEKIAHVEAGANCAWVPSPTAATLHALHYHKVNIFAIQNNLKGRRRAKLTELLTIPIDPTPETTTLEEITKELDNNAQSILGYVVRWIDQGIGCSKVPDINNIGLMEDRATLRISAQHLANWLHHGILKKAQVTEALKRMAEVVDKQNKDDEAYRPMATNFEKSIAFQAACDLIFKGRTQPSGYTEPILHQKRQQRKTRL